MSQFLAGRTWYPSAKILGRGGGVGRGWSHHPRATGALCHPIPAFAVKFNLVGL